MGLMRETPARRIAGELSCRIERSLSIKTKSHQQVGHRPMNQLRRHALPGALLMLLAGPSPVVAQPVQPPTQAEAQAALNPPTSFSAAQLDQMLAPIALYPDQLLVELLMAATFPQQVVDAGKWLQDASNAALKGDDLVSALQKLPWDPSVKSLAAFPQIIAMMNDHLDWTEALGTAFAGQQVQTMARVQFLRDRAKAAGHLDSTPQIAVTEQESDIVIEPADPNTIYVPVYNPAVVYGSWPDSDAPPVYLAPPPGFYSGEIGDGIGFSVGFGVAGALWGWGHPNWHQHEVVIDSQRYFGITTTPRIIGNHVALVNNTWHRTGPVATVPEPARPPPPAASPEHPPGTVTSTAFRAPASAVPAPPPAHPEQREEKQPPHPEEPTAAPPPQPNEARPSEVPHPPEGQPAPPPPRPGPPPPAIVRPAPQPEPRLAPQPEARPAPQPEERPAPGAPARPPAKKPPPKPGEEPDHH
jgi:hypothetical protein